MRLRDWFRACKDMNEAHVSFGLAKLLKEKGYKEECKYFYDWSGDTEEPKIYYLNCGTRNSNTDDFPSRCSMPSVGEVIRWIRSKHNIYTSTTSIRNGYSTGIDTRFRSAQLCSDLSYEDHIELVLEYILKKLI